MEEYKIEARASVPYAMYIKANSEEEARSIAEQKAESYQRTTIQHGNPEITNSYDTWTMRVDDFGLEIESVNTVCRRPFIPTFDD